MIPQLLVSLLVNIIVHDVSATTSNYSDINSFAKITKESYAALSALNKSAFVLFSSQR